MVEENCEAVDTAKTYPLIIRGGRQIAKVSSLPNSRTLHSLIDHLRGNQTDPYNVILHSKDAETTVEEPCKPANNTPEQENNTPPCDLDLLKYESTVLDSTPSVYITNDPCPHCAIQGLGISARDARINYQLGDATKGPIVSPFVADLRCGCEFPCKLKCFLTDPEGWPLKRLIKLTACLSDLTSACAQVSTKKVRVLLRLNDHLRKEENLRGWVLIVEGKTQEAVYSVLRFIEKKLIAEKIVELVGSTRV
ncbi:unnamed protein product [Hydatigera taeniaeformis]|uniref:CMP/dCMP-type deaminase domain-containing protein n=1 Tax=Hydatigena taeniaeformis TaxID=6205 RepID=A0A0R3WJ58_HYDTA|nr:unnamed protein product [Hydatigera taeniaeformis]